jgi:magnesium-transporting ATPase (P-type)
MKKDEYTIHVGKNVPPS